VFIKRKEAKKKKKRKKKKKKLKELIGGNLKDIRLERRNILKELGVRMNNNDFWEWILGMGKADQETLNQI